jgi:hypothetical protein
VEALQQVQRERPAPQLPLGLSERAPVVEDLQDILSPEESTASCVVSGDSNTVGFGTP